MKYCPYCGAGLDTDMLFCPSCGKKFKDAVQKEEQSDKTIYQNLEKKGIPECSVDNNNFNVETDAEENQGETVADDCKQDSGPSAKQKRNKKKKICIVGVAVIVAALITLFCTGIIGTSNIEKSAKSVLYLEMYNMNDELTGTASGFMLNNKTTLVTNYHVINGAYKIIAKTFDGSESTEILTIISYDKDRDLAILKTDKPMKVRPLKAANSDVVTQGDNVYLVGYSLGIANTLSNGIISALYNDGTLDWIQITAPASAGNSGGPLLNKKGQVIGVLSGTYTEGENMNLAIPVNYVKEMLQNNNEELMADVYEENATGYNAYLASVKLEFNDFRSNASKYEGQLVSVEGYCVSLYDTDYFYLMNESISWRSIIFCKIDNEESVEINSNGKYLKDGAKIIVCGYCDTKSGEKVSIRNVQYVYVE